LREISRITHRSLPKFQKEQLLAVSYLRHISAKSVHIFIFMEKSMPHKKGKQEKDAKPRKKIKGKGQKKMKIKEARRRRRKGKIVITERDVRKKRYEQK